MYNVVQFFYFKQMFFWTLYSLKNSDKKYGKFQKKKKKN